ncbi:hypothetical protein [Pedobacter faecalis]|uniref:hypothetical protein n=1 Tax=Pedobacter faecalis TaxID=3041495 RepID=UPI0025512697|nr:hypothetical protein [Pedobacter sp. ELA7]
MKEQEKTLIHGSILHILDWMAKECMTFGLARAVQEELADIKDLIDPNPFFKPGGEGVIGFPGVDCQLLALVEDKLVVNVMNSAKRIIEAKEHFSAMVNQEHISDAFSKLHFAIAIQTFENIPNFDTEDSTDDQGRVYEFYYMLLMKLNVCAHQCKLGRFDVFDESDLAFEEHFYAWYEIDMGDCEEGKLLTKLMIDISNDMTAF